MQENSDSATSTTGHIVSGVAEPYLSLADAAKLAGVSSSTLLRFSEAGYFRMYQSNGDSRFSRLEIFQVFGPVLHTESPTAATSSAEPAQTEAAPFEPASPAEPDNKQSMEKSGTISSEENVQSVDLSSEQDAVLSEITLSQKIEKFIEPSREKEHSISLDPFKQVLQLQEELLNQKNRLIAELTKERDWLRARLERMEEKSDKDQMLLMVESQKVRTLLGQDSASAAPGAGNNQLGFLNRALAWLNPKN